MKKCLPLLSLLLILLLSACGGKEATPDSSQEIHPHTFTEHGFNATHHFMLCQCGETDNAAPHDFTEDEFCETCGFYIYGMGDGCYSICIPDEYGSIVVQKDFDAHDKVIYNWHAEYEYYDDHNPKHIKEYLDDVLLSEQTFQRCENPENGDVYLSEEVYFSEDGSQERLTYDENCYIQSYIITDSLGEAITREDYTYEFDAAGNCTYEVCHTNGILSREVFYEPDTEGSFYACRFVYYDENGQLESEYRFDAYGNKID